eukprot:2375462-Ditylum_brightwellii.AAC.1
MYITNLDAPMYRDHDLDGVLVEAEKQKKTNYLEPSLDCQKHFTFLVYSAYGMAEDEAKVAKKHMVSHLETKLMHQYSEMCCFIHAGMALAIVHCTTLLLQDPQEGDSHLHQPDCMKQEKSDLSLTTASLAVVNQQDCLAPLLSLGSGWGSSWFIARSSWQLI